MRGDSVEGVTVDEVYEEALGRGAIVDASTPLTDVVDALEFKEVLDALYVVDHRDRYVGVITRSDLLGWLEHNLEAPQSRDAFPWDALADSIQAGRAEDAIHPRSGQIPVEPREPIEGALRKMLAAGLTVLPVVSPDGDVEGELTLTRALRHAIDQR